MIFKQHPYKNQIWRDLPTPTGPYPYHLRLSDVLPASQMAAITKSGGLTIHVVGDTGGVQMPISQQFVADAMERDFAPTESEIPSFFYILGDVIYCYGEADNYCPQFYQPYMHYPAPIFAIPGNHDGDLATRAPQGVNSLEAFVNNFCAVSPHISIDAGPVDRDTMTQPNVYWTLLTPYSTMIGLYSNVPEGGVIKQDQIDWFVSELSGAPVDKALVVSVHHPTFSGDTDCGGSITMLSTLDAAFKEADRYPDIVFSGHVHNYQRYTRRVAGREIPYIVAGGGGYWNLHKLQSDPDGTPLEVPTATGEPGVTLENYCVDRHGYLKMRFEDGMITGEYYGVTESTQPSSGRASRLDTFAIDLVQHKVVTSKRRP